MKKKWLIMIISAAVVVVALGVVGGAVYAKSNTPADNTTAKKGPQTELADRVAKILGQDNATVENAFNQAMSDMGKERAAQMLKAEEARIDKMVADGKMNAADAAKMKTWMESRPAVTANGPGAFPAFGPGNCAPGAMGRFGQNAPKPNTAPNGMRPFRGAPDNFTMPFKTK